MIIRFSGIRRRTVMVLKFSQWLKVVVVFSIVVALLKGLPLLYSQAIRHLGVTMMQYDTCKLYVLFFQYIMTYFFLSSCAWQKGVNVRAVMLGTPRSASLFPAEGHEDKTLVK